MNKISRRKFVNRSFISVTGIAIAPAWINSCGSKTLKQNLMSEFNVNDYLNYFGVTKEIISKIISTALSKGGDYCDLYFQNNIFNYLGLEDGEVNRAYSNVDLGVGIRVLKGIQTGYSYSENLSVEAMENAAKTAANIANSDAKPFNQQLIDYAHQNYYRLTTAWEDVSVDSKIPYLQKLNTETFNLDSRVIKSTIGFMDETSYILFANSEGRIVADYRPMGQLSLSVIAEQDGRREQNGYSISVRNDINHFSDENIKRMAKEAVESATRLFDAVKPTGGEMEVVLAAGGSGILLHEAIGHGMEADFNRKNISIFSDKMNKKVAADFVTIVDNGTNPNIRGSLNIDDEGNDTQNTVLVENGILKSYLHDRLSAQHYGVAPTGNGRRQSFRHIPMPRMRNTYMLNGPHEKDEILSSVKKGIYCESFTNGQVNIGGGDFTFYVKNGYLIENGKLTQPIKDINIIGNGPEVLQNITMAANDFEMSEGGWTCGKDGQGVPVSQGLPTVKVSKITVGGV